MVQIWYMDDSTEDPRLDHHLCPPEYVPVDKVFFLSRVEIHQINVENLPNDDSFSKLRKENGYIYDDMITVARDTLPNYEETIKKFYSEHLHDDEEVRLFLEGSGYFDVRDIFDNWLRIKAEKGDLIILPAGIYHRFTPDMTNYAKVMRLFTQSPVWKAINRSTVDETKDEPESRKIHLGLLGKHSLWVLQNEIDTNEV